MSIVTLPSISKGQENLVTLNKADLASQAKVIADSYFSQQSNWDKVVLHYISNEGQQKKEVVFDATQVTPEGVLFLTDKSRDQFEILSVTIFDFDGGYLKLYRGDLTTSEFDFIVGGSFGGFGQLDRHGNSNFITGDDFIEVDSFQYQWGSSARSVESLGNAGFFEFQLPSSYETQLPNSDSDLFIGINNQTVKSNTYPFYSSIGPCFYLIGGTDQYQIRTDSQQLAAHSGTGLEGGSVLRIEWEGTTFRWMVDGQVVYQNSSIGGMPSAKYLEMVFRGIGRIENCKRGDL